MVGTSRQILLLLLSSAILSPGINAQAQVDQQAITQRLLGGDVEERNRALNSVAREIQAKRPIGQELRKALIALLERQNQIVREAERAGQFVADVEDPEFIARLSRTVAELRDPAAIPALSEATYGGRDVIKALAGFGEQALPDVIRVVSSRDSHYDVVDLGLITLRIMVENRSTRPLSGRALDAIRRAASQRLTGKQYFTSLWWAIDLAVALNDPALVKIVEALASDPREINARGINNPAVIEETQKRAADRLAGIQGLPRL